MFNYYFGFGEVFLRKIFLLITAIPFMFPFFSMAQGVSDKDYKLVELLNGIYRGSPKAISTFPAEGQKDGLLGFINLHGLVITRSDGDCPSNKSGVCDAYIYITRADYPRYRPGDRLAFCGAVSMWKASDKNLKAWRPANALAEAIVAGNTAFALRVIDDKNASYCR